MKDKNIDVPFYRQIQREINRIENKAHSYTGSFYFVRILQIILAGTITVLSGMTDANHDYVNYILLLGALVTAITAIDTLFQIDAKKNTYKLILFELRAIRAEFVFHHMQNKEITDPQFMEEMFEKYRRSYSYARDLIGTDTEKETKTAEEEMS